MASAEFTYLNGLGWELVALMKAWILRSRSVTELRTHHRKEVDIKIGRNRLVDCIKEASEFGLIITGIATVDTVLFLTSSATNRVFIP